MPTEDDEDGGSQTPFNETRSPPRSPNTRGEAAASATAADAAASATRAGADYDPDLDEEVHYDNKGKGRGNGEALMRVSRIIGFMAKPALFDGAGTRPIHKVRRVGSHSESFHVNCEPVLRTTGGLCRNNELRDLQGQLRP